jgi:hypothetical protein
VSLPGVSTAKWKSASWPSASANLARSSAAAMTRRIEAAGQQGDMLRQGEGALEGVAVEAATLAPPAAGLSHLRIPAIHSSRHAGESRHPWSDIEMWRDGFRLSPE